MAAVHAHDPRFFVRCGIQECPRTYHNFYSFKKHLYRKHRESLDTVSEPYGEHDGSLSDSYLEVDNEESWLYENQGSAPESPLATNMVTVTPHRLSSIERKKQLALFLLKTREIRKVSQVALDGVIADFTQILRKTVYELKLEVSARLEAKGMSIATFEGLADVFCDPQMTNPFQQLDTKFLQEKFYREHLNLLVRITHAMCRCIANIKTFAMYNGSSVAYV